MNGFLPSSSNDHTKLSSTGLLGKLQKSPFREDFIYWEKEHTGESVDRWAEEEEKRQ